MKLAALYAAIAAAASIVGGQALLDQILPPSADVVVLTNLRTLNSMAQSRLMDDTLTIEEALAGAAADLDAGIVVEGRTARHQILDACMVLTVHGFAAGQDIAPCAEVLR
jgi:hypothetical protein